MFTSSDVESDGYRKPGDQEEDKVATVVQGKQKIDASLAKVIIENQAVMRKHNVKNAAEAQKKHFELKAERRDLRVRLDKFQKDFEAANNRKIRYTKDIAPVANDFKRYKEMKDEIA